MEKLITSASPHIHSGASTRRIMLDVIIALLPAAIASAVIFGMRANVILLVCIVSAVLAEFLFNLITRHEQTVGDLSAVVTGLLLGLNLSTNVPIWQCVIGSVFAVVVVKGLFGGLGRNFANPAITARVFMLIAFSSVAGGAMPAVVELEASATPLEQLANGASQLPSLLDMFLGVYGGAIGETCTLALLLGFVYLLVRKVIRWHIPVVFIGTVFVCSLIASGDFVAALYQILGGGLFLGAIFMATDYVTSPLTRHGQIIYGIGCGVLTILIRYFGGYSEGVSYAILVMNTCVVLLDRMGRPTRFGAPKKEAVKK